MATMRALAAQTEVSSAGVFQRRAARPSLRCRAEAPAPTDNASAQATAKPVASTSNPAVAEVSGNKILTVPEWVPEQAVPVLKFLNAEDFKLKESDLYKKYLAKYVENEFVIQSTGFKKLPETINGRAAMLGFATGALGEIFGAGPILAQLSRWPQPSLIILALITAGSIIPVVKGTKGDFLESLRDTYTLPEGWFTEANERVHGRLAMLGLGSLILIELLKGSAVL